MNTTCTDNLPNADARRSGVYGSFRSRRIIIAFLLATTLLSSMVHGFLDGRWAVKADKNQIGDQLSELPKQFGNWVMVREMGLDSNAEQMLRCHGDAVRVYRHSENGSMITVAVLFGPRGPIAVHTPEVCFSGIGTDQTRERRVETIEDSENEHTFWSVEFATDGNNFPTQSVWYAWSDGGPFYAAKRPRFWFTDDLYKIQIQGPVPDPAYDACEDFLGALLPALMPHIQ